jgi:acetyl-CoA acetyltransferase
MGQWKKRIAIVGIGESGIGTVPGMDNYELSRQALVRALDDCGIRKSEIDGVMTTGSFAVLNPMYTVLFCEHLGLRPRYTSIMQIGGATHILNLLTAANAIDSGMCEIALVASAESLRSLAGFQQLMRIFGSTGGGVTAAFSGIGHADFEVPFGTTLISGYALYANRHMAEFGTTREQLAQVAVSIRKHASLHPHAQKRNEITIEEALNGKPIASPLTKDQCSLISDGGAALIVTTLERARDLKKAPIEILGGGAKTEQEHVTLSKSFITTPAVSAGKDCFGAAGLTPADVDFAELYDCFSISPLISLEDFGFCKKGEGGAFVEGGKRIEIGGELPIVTHGGCLSHCHPGLPSGIFHITEAVKQLRGEAEAGRQIKDARIGFVSGIGGVFSSFTALLLGKE